MIVTVGTQECYIEIKKCGQVLGKCGTINQIRPIKFIPCAIWASSRDKWYVLSGTTLVDIASKKNRGQHSEIAFECMTRTLRTKCGVDRAIECDDKGLEKAIRNAIKEDMDHSEYKKRMSDLKNEILALNKKYKDKFGK